MNNGFVCLDKGIHNSISKPLQYFEQVNELEKESKTYNAEYQER
jgi:hypothetical protein